MNNIIINQVQNLVSKKLNVSLENINSKNRNRDNILARGLIFYVLKENYNYTYVYIGKAFNLHYTSIIHQVANIKKFISINDYLVCNAISTIYDDLSSINSSNEFSFVTLKININLISKYGRDNLIGKINELIKQL